MSFLSSGLLLYCDFLVIDSAFTFLSSSTQKQFRRTLRLRFAVQFVTLSFVLLASSCQRQDTLVHELVAGGTVQDLYRALVLIEPIQSDTELDYIYRIIAEVESQIEEPGEESLPSQGQSQETSADRDAWKALLSQALSARDSYLVWKGDYDLKKQILLEIGTAVDTYRARFGEFPPDWKALLESDLVAASPEGEVLDPWENPLHITMQAMGERNRLEIRSFGPDKTPDTEDDLLFEIEG